MDESVSSRIRQAETAIANLKANFAFWVRTDVDSIGAHLESARLAASPSALSSELEALRRIAHNIKGQGGTFGCHQLSAAAADLDAFLKGRPEEPDMAIVAALVAKLNQAFTTELA